MPPFQAAVAEAARLPSKGILTLETGLGPAGAQLLASVPSTSGDVSMELGSPGSSSSASLTYSGAGSSGGFKPPPVVPALPSFAAFVDRLKNPYAAWHPEKTLTFLDGGDDKSGVIEAFRKARADYLRTIALGRSASSISGSAFVDGRYFARQLYLPLIIGCMESVAEMEDYILAMFPDTVKRQVQECKSVLERGGVVELQRWIEVKSEHDSEIVRLDVVGKKTREMEAASGGQPLGKTAKKKIRDAGSSSKSNEKRKRAYEITREKLEEMLILRCELWEQLYNFFSTHDRPPLEASEHMNLPRVA